MLSMPARDDIRPHKIRAISKAMKIEMETCRTKEFLAWKHMRSTMLAKISLTGQVTFT